ncbi:MAG: type II toxin-antitoxin system HipA family toxin [Mariprofundus sp.]|nr:type II toxin-antitoxin system HipA family toxin [Mariprofundus sp.]
MKSLDIIYDPRGILVGRLYCYGRDILFEYDKAFLETGLNLSPFKLKFAVGVQKSDAEFRHRLHGLFDDSLPDGWGLLLMDKELRKRGISTPPTPLERLAYIGGAAMGALSYRPSMRDGQCNDLFDIQQVAEESVRLFEGEINDVLPAIARAGGSSGGARPKVLVGICDHKMVSGEKGIPDGYEHWIIKFAAKKDLAIAGKHEFACYLMAKDAGLDMMESRLFHVGDHYFFGTKRFDRMGDQKIHMHTAANLVDANFREPALDYETLCRITTLLTGNQADVLMMFRIMVFNVAIKNQDDHAKNFSFLMDDCGVWRLAPAYDLTQSILPSNEHSTSVAGKGCNISRDDMLVVAKNAGISSSGAREIIEQIYDVTSREHDYMDAAKAHCKQVATNNFIERKEGEGK